MNAILQDQFQRVENALNALIDSIASYTPSTQAVETLLEADDELTRGLDQLSTHQTNYAKIIQLRQTSAALSDQITASLTLLSTTRAELLATPATVFPEDDGSREVAYDELLAYAKKISKFTVPPTYRASLPPAGDSPANAASPADGTAQTAFGEKSHQDGRDRSVGADHVMVMANGTTNKEIDNAQDQPKTMTRSEGVAIAALPTQESEWLDPAATFAFTPWPTEDVIVRGGLGRIQAMLDAGEDPALIKSTDEVQLPEDVKVEDEDGGKVKQEEEEKDMQSAAAPAESQLPTRDQDASMGNQEHHQQQQQQQPARPRQAEPPKPAVFGGLDLYDPDEE